jgi:hypothetical protein
MYKAFDRYGEMRGRFESEPYLFIVRTSETQCNVARHIASDKVIPDHVGKTVLHDASSNLPLTHAIWSLSIFSFSQESGNVKISTISLLTQIISKSCHGQYPLIAPHF